MTFTERSSSFDAPPRGPIVGKHDQGLRQPAAQPSRGRRMMRWILSPDSLLTIARLIEELGAAEEDR
jgi:hypothetical protein